MTDFHVVLSRSAQRSLQTALRQRLNVLSGHEAAPHLGPLADGRQRAAFFREMYASIGWPSEELDGFLPDDAYAEWGAVHEAIAHAKPRRVMIWTSEGSEGHVFFRMAVHFLSQFGPALWRVIVRGGGKSLPVDIAPIDWLISSLPDATKITASDLQSYRDEFQEMAADQHPLRVMMPDGRIAFHDLSYYDDAILRCCSTAWERTSYVVACVLGHTEAPNSPGDIVIFARLLHLVQTRRLETDGDVETMHDHGLRTRLVRMPRS